MSETTLLESRVDKIERDNRRLKLTLGALLLALAAVPLVGAVMPGQIPELITAREFHVIDENGTPRASMSTSGISYYGENGSRASMDNLGIRYWDGTGTIRADMSAIGITYAYENGTLRALMTDTGIVYLDENEAVRAVMNLGGIHYRDENGTTVWSTACAPNC